MTKTFLHLGVTAYGGLAIVEPIRHRIVQEKSWLNQKRILGWVGFHLRQTKGALVK